MKTDNKDEAKSFLKNKGHNMDAMRDPQDMSLTISTVPLLETMSDFHNHMKAQYRFYPETFERVVKPVECGDCDGLNQPLNKDCGNCWGTDYAILWNNALTLDQLIERCKDMKNKVEQMDYYIINGTTKSTIRLSDGTVKLPRNYEGVEG